MDSTDGKVSTLHLQCLNGLKPVIQGDNGVLAGHVRDMVLEEGDIDSPVLLCEAVADLVDALILLVLQLIASRRRLPYLAELLPQPR